MFTISTNLNIFLMPEKAKQSRNRFASTEVHTGAAKPSAGTDQEKGGASIKHFEESRLDLQREAEEELGLAISVGHFGK